jgi:uncharacterized OB-fold protein
MDTRQKGFVRPNTDRDSEPWWAHVAAGRLMLPRCNKCGRRWFPPTPGCPHCGSPEVELAPADPHGTVYSWVVINRALNPAFVEDAPYTIVAVDLKDGARMFGRLFMEGGTIVDGLPVIAEIYAVNGNHLVGFRHNQD